MNEKEFFYRLGQSIYKIDSVYDVLAKKVDIPPTLLWILYALNDGKKHSQRDICENWSLPKSTVNTIIKELEEKKLVILIQIKGKRREMFVELTKKGCMYASEKLESVYLFEKCIYEKIKQNATQILENFESIAKKLYEEVNKNEKDF